MLALAAVRRARAGADRTRVAGRGQRPGIRDARDRTRRADLRVGAALVATRTRPRPEPAALLGRVAAGRRRGAVVDDGPGAEPARHARSRSRSGRSPPGTCSWCSRRRSRPGRRGCSAPSSAPTRCRRCSAAPSSASARSCCARTSRICSCRRACWCRSRSGSRCAECAASASAASLGVLERGDRRRAVPDLPRAARDARTDGAGRPGARPVAARRAARGAAEHRPRAGRRARSPARSSSRRW